MPENDDIQKSTAIQGKAAAQSLPENKGLWDKYTQVWLEGRRKARDPQLKSMFQLVVGFFAVHPGSAIFFVILSSPMAVWVLTHAREAVSGERTGEYLGVVGALLAVIISFFIAVIVDDDTSRKIQETTKNIQATSEVLDKEVRPRLEHTSRVLNDEVKIQLQNTSNELAQTHRQLDSLVRLKPVSTFFQVLTTIQRILEGCTTSIEIDGRREAREPGQKRNLYILNPTEWFGTTLSYNLEAVLAYDQKSKLDLGKITQAQIHKRIQDIQKTITDNRSTFCQLAKDVEVKVSYAVLAPSEDVTPYQSEHAQQEFLGALADPVTKEKVFAFEGTPFYQEYLQPLASAGSVDVFPIAEASQELLAKTIGLTQGELKPARQTYLVPVNLLEKRKAALKMAAKDIADYQPDGRAAFVYELYQKQWEQLRQLHDNFELHDVNFSMKLLTEAPFHIFMNHKEIDGRHEGECLFVFANKYNLPRAGGVAGFTTSDPELVHAFLQIYEAAVRIHDAFPDLPPQFKDVPFPMRQTNN